ncbi:thyrostimulin alpha-2 subunit-like isoform X2 [Asterias amurensis]
MQWYKVVLTLVSLSVCLCSLLATAQQRPYWERSGCHLVGYSTLVQIPGCHKTRVDMNACRGYCVTYTLLSTFNQIVSNNIRYSSRGTCCAIGDTHDVIVILACENNEQKSVTYKSAASCSCTLCTQEDTSQLNNV